MRKLCLPMLLVALACGGDDAAGVDAGPDGDGGPVADAGAVPVSRQACATERVLVSNQTVIHRKSFEYDEAGRLGVQLLELGWDFFDEGRDVSGDDTSRLFRYSYDVDGRQSSFEADVGNDGTFEWVRYHFRDSDSGQIQYWVDDRDVTTTFAWTHRGNYTYTDGLLTRFEEVNYTTPTTIYNRLDYEYTDDRVSKIIRNLNPNTGGQECADYEEIHTRNEDGLITRLDLDGQIGGGATACPNALIDGVAELVVFYDYDDEGRLIQRRYDSGGDGSIERRETIEYDCE